MWDSAMCGSGIQDVQKIEQEKEDEEQELYEHTNSSAVLRHQTFVDNKLVINITVIQFIFLKGKSV